MPPSTIGTTCSRSPSHRPGHRIGLPPVGWPAASREGEPWLAPLFPIDCPQQGDLEVAELAAFHPLEALSCFGHRGLRVRAASIVIPGVVERDPPLPNYTIRAQVAWHRRWVPVELRNDGGGGCRSAVFHARLRRIPRRSRVAVAVRSVRPRRRVVMHPASPVWRPGIAVALCSRRRPGHSALLQSFRCQRFGGRRSAHRVGTLGDSTSRDPR